MSSPYDQRTSRLRLEWGPTGATAVAGGARYAVVVDVLSFTTTLTVAADLGIDVLPYPWQDGSASAYAREHRATLAFGRSEALELGGDAVSLSPTSLRVASGLRRVVLPSPNGSTTSFRLNEAGATVVGASLRNATAVARWLADRLEGDRSASVVVVAAGERWHDGSLRPCVEDLLGAGAVLAGLGEVGSWDASPEADVEVALEVDSSDVVPVLSGISFTRSTGSDLGSGG